MNNIGGKEIDTPDSLRAERDALRAQLDAINSRPMQTACDDCKADRDALRSVLREVVSGCRDRYDPETDFGGVWAAAIERAEELCK